VDKSIAVFTEGFKPQRFQGRVVLLVNEHSASAAEIVAAFVAENKLATIVGTKTPGRLMSGSAFKVGHGFIVGLPVAGYFTWNGTMIEGKGIDPNVAVPSDSDALRQGSDVQMERALAIAKGW
jgi:carboxyl-terminal processing protease